MYRKFWANSPQQGSTDKIFLLLKHGVFMNANKFNRFLIYNLNIKYYFMINCKWRVLHSSIFSALSLKAAIMQWDRTLPQPAICLAAWVQECTRDLSHILPGMAVEGKSNTMTPMINQKRMLPRDGIRQSVFHFSLEFLPSLSDMACLMTSFNLFNSIHDFPA